MTTGLTRLRAASIAAALILTGCGQGSGSTDDAKPARVSTAKDGRVGSIAGVTKVEVTDLYVTVRAAIPESWDGAAYLDRSSELVRQIAKAVQGGAGDVPDGFASLNLLIEVPTQDRLGQDGSGRLLNISFTGDDLRLARLDGLSGARLLALAHEVRAPSTMAARALGQWCAKGNNLADAPNVCAEAS